MWKYTGQVRPPFADVPARGQVSVWDFPRPPRLETVPAAVEVRAGGRVLARTTAALRVCETAAPPTYYLPPDDVDTGALAPVAGRSLCEWKGAAVYFALAAGGEPVAWSYPEPFTPFERLRNYVSFYPGRVECFVGGERVKPQPGHFYGGWITSDLVGPFKGEPGSEGW
ncbi:MAG: DUF427 domain-containing protein [Gammaproteobacteria bacterium]